MGQQVAVYSGADGSGNGMIDQADFDFWRARFGNRRWPAGSGGGTSLNASPNPHRTSRPDSCNGRVGIPATIVVGWVEFHETHRPAATARCCMPSTRSSLHRSVTLFRRTRPQSQTLPKNRSLGSLPPIRRNSASPPPVDPKFRMHVNAPLDEMRSQGGPRRRG